MPDPQPAPFVVGVGRSGTTLLRLMLDAHPELAVPPETHFIPRLFKALDADASAADAVEFLRTKRRWPAFGVEPGALRERIEVTGEVTPTTVTRAFFELYAESRGKPRWGDKTPPYVARMPRVQKVVPEARFVHLIRDGRAVSRSLSRAHFGPDTLAGAAGQWARRVDRAQRTAAKLDHYLEVRYEELVADPEPVLRRICDFAELAWDPAMLAYHDDAADRMAEDAHDMRRADGTVVSAQMRADLHRTTAERPLAERAEGWRSELSAGEVAEVEAVAGETLRRLGYAG
jgi:hypothetical protein